MKAIKEMVRKRSPLPWVLAAWAVLLAIPAFSSDGRIPIGTVPYTISAAGSYYLTGDLVYGSAAAAITIAANNVSLDLNGHVLTETSTAGGSSCVHASGYTNLKVSNGILKGGSLAVDIENVSAGLITVDGLTITGFSGTGITIGGAGSEPAVQVTSNRISSNFGFANTKGIYLSTTWGGRVSANVLSGEFPNQGIGIDLWQSTALLVTDNAVTYYNTGIFIGGSSGDVKAFGNNASYNGYGIWVETSANMDIEENLMSSNSNMGLIFNPGVASYIFKNNVATGNSTNYACAGGTDGGGNL